MVGVIAFVGQQPPKRAGGLDQRLGHADIVDVSWTEQQHARSAEMVDEAMNLGRAAATRAAYRLGEGPPFAPAAERWALT
jgi:hypothetical protein